MSVMIENTEELLALVKKMDLKVSNVEELRHLLATINSNYNPDVARQKIGKQLSLTVPGAMAGSAAVASFFLLVAGTMPPYIIMGGLAVIWGAVAVVSTGAVIAGAILAGVSRGRTMPDNLPEQPVSRGGPFVTHITKDLSI